jgi:uncharacterized protein
MRLRTTLSWVFALLLCVPAVFADEASKAAKVEEFMRLSRMKETLEETMDAVSRQLDAQTMQSIVGGKLPPELQEDFERFQDDVVDLVDGAMNWDDMKPHYVRIYMQAFTEEELDGIIAFYRSPVGQRFVEKMPELMNQAMEISQQRLATILPQLQQLQREWRELVQRKVGSPANDN